MLNNRLELVKEGVPKALLTWHLPRDEELFYPIAFQFADDVDDALKSEMFEIAKRPLKVKEKQFKPAVYGSSDHFTALARPLGRLGFRTRYFGAAQRGHALDDRPIEAP